MVAVAQLVEPRIVIPVVVGSNPIGHPTFRGAESSATCFPSKDILPQTWRWPESLPLWLVRAMLGVFWPFRSTPPTCRV
jgi:beta-glucosidase-like glycosyl hydrolase